MEENNNNQDNGTQDQAILERTFVAANEIGGQGTQIGSAYKGLGAVMDYSSVIDHTLKGETKEAEAAYLSIVASTVVQEGLVAAGACAALTPAGCAVVIVATAIATENAVNNYPLGVDAFKSATNMEEMVKHLGEIGLGYLGDELQHILDVITELSKTNDRLIELGEGQHRGSKLSPFEALKKSLDNISKLLPDFSGDISDISQTINTFFNSAQNWAQPRDPLILDLDGDGLETTGFDAASPIYFDHDLNGIKEGTGWVKADDGFLVLDRNGNGTIDNGLELFGDHTLLMTGDYAADGFAALAQEDTNQDGKVDANDVRFAELRVWRDLNQNGLSEANELFTLNSLGIASINVASTDYSQMLANGNQIADLGSYTKTDGSTGITGNLADINLVANPFYRQFTTHPDTSAVAHLPDMQGSGQVRDLREAASLFSPLALTLSIFSAQTTRTGQLAQLDKLIADWTISSGMQTRDSDFYLRYR